MKIKKMCFFITLSITFLRIIKIIKEKNKIIENITGICERYHLYYDVCNHWLSNMQKGKKIESYLLRYHINSVAIYGMGTIGELLYEELKKTNIKIKYVIDKNINTKIKKDNIIYIPINTLVMENLVDAIIITPVFDYESIKKELENRGCFCKVVSLEDMVYGA